MTGSQSIDIREIQFASPDAKKNLDALPEDIRFMINGLLRAVQNNKPLPPKRVTELKGDMAGIIELRQDFDTNTYRAYYVARFKEVIFVLDIEMKKSASGSAIPQPTKDMLKKRLKVASQMYDANKSDYQAQYATREARKAEQEIRRSNQHRHQRRPK